MASSIPMKYEQFSKRCILCIDGNLTGTTIPDESVPGTDGRVGVLQTSQIARTEASSSDAV